MKRAIAYAAFQLWLALPPSLELGPSVASFQAPEQIAANGSVRVLLGSYNGVESPIEAPSPINYLSVTLEPGERWEYIPPRGHTVLWASPVEGELLAGGEPLHSQELVAFESAKTSVVFSAVSKTQFVLGSAVPHPHDLSLGYYSVHTSSEALREGEAYIAKLEDELVACWTTRAVSYRLRLLNACA